MCRFTVNFRKQLQEPWEKQGSLQLSVSWYCCSPHMDLSMTECGGNGASALLSSDPWDWNGIWTVLNFCDFRYGHIPVINLRGISALYECNTYTRRHWRVIICLQLLPTAIPGLTQGKLDQEGSSSSCHLSEWSQFPGAAMKPYRITVVTLWRWWWWRWWWQPNPEESPFHYKVTIMSKKSAALICTCQPQWREESGVTESKVIL